MGPISFTAVSPAGALLINGDQTVAWVVGDQVEVPIDGGAQVFTVTQRRWYIVGGMVQQARVRYTLERA